MKFACANCGQHLEIDDGTTVLRALCPACKHETPVRNSNDIPKTPTSIQANDPSLRTKLRWWAVGGIVVGYLFLLMYVSVRRDQYDDPSTIIKSAGVALALGIAAIIVGLRVRNTTRAWVDLGFGILLLAIALTLSKSLDVPQGLKILYGGVTLLSIGLITTILAVGIIEARRLGCTTAFCRYALIITASIGLLAYAVQLLVLLADGTTGPSAVSSAIHSGDPIVIVYTGIVYVGLLAILTCGLTDGLRYRTATTLYNTVLTIFWIILCLVPGITITLFLLGTSQAPLSSQIAIFITNIVGVLIPTYGAMYLTIGGLRNGLLSRATYPTVHVVNSAVVSKDTAPHSPADNDISVTRTTASTLEQQLAALRVLHSKDLITDEDYQCKKQELLTRL